MKCDYWQDNLIVGDKTFGVCLNNDVGLMIYTSEDRKECQHSSICKYCSDVNHVKSDVENYELVISCLDMLLDLKTIIEFHSSDESSDFSSQDQLVHSLFITIEYIQKLRRILEKKPRYTVKRIE